MGWVGLGWVGSVDGLARLSRVTENGPTDNCGIHAD